MSLNSFSIKGNLVNIHERSIKPSEIIVEEGMIKKINVIDESVNGFLMPGFIDAHVHIESSMLVPTEFARMAVVHGTVATVSDPHEIGNVLGVEGVNFMIENGSEVNFKFYFGAPSCVPATPFETAGAQISMEQVDELLSRKEIKYLSEMMNWPGVLNDDPEVKAKIASAVKHGKPVDGHAPGLKGEQAKIYIDAGISTDHECYSADEALGKLNYGMKIIIREGSAAKNFEALYPLLEDHYENMMLCSDDKHPDSLELGHINQLAARAVANGIDKFKVLQAACLNPIEHYKLDVGQLKVGDPADFIVCHDLENFQVKEAYINGKKVSENGKSLIPQFKTEAPNNFNAHPISKDSLVVAAEGEKIRVIEALDGELITNELVTEARILDQNVVSNPQNDILKIVVVNRYQPTENPSKAFIKGFGLKSGAIASSVAHDSHNIVAVGVDDQSICEAINLIIAEKGGISAVNLENKKIIALPVAGLMTNRDGYQVSKDYTEIDQMAKEMGSELGSPFMTLSFMALLVIPSLKLSDKGLFNGKTFQFTDNFINMGNESKGKAESYFAELGKKLDDLFEDMSDKNSEVRKEFDERLEELKKSGEKIKSEFEEFTDNNKDSFEDAKDRLSEFGTDLKTSFEKLFRKKS
ncbi:MAG: adenine deaminase [Bacteroidota bacterium]